jgi:hypothetical protein
MMNNNHSQVLHNNKIRINIFHKNNNNKLINSLHAIVFAYYFYGITQYN